MSGSISNVVIESEIVDNVGVPFRISRIYHHIPKYQYTCGLLSANLLPVYCFFYWMMSDTLSHTQISTIKQIPVQDYCWKSLYKQSNIPRITNMVSVILLTYFPDLLTVIDYIHIQIHLLTYLLMCFKCICMKGDGFDRACCIRIETSICRISVKSPLVHSYIKYCISGKSQNFSCGFHQKVSFSSG